MNKYDIIFESLQERLSNNELSFEEASVLNELAYSKYVTESSEEYSAEKEAEFLGKYRSLVSEYKSDYLKVLTATKKPKKVNIDYAKLWISSCENDLNKMIDLLKHTPLLSKKALANSNKFIKTLAITVGSTVAIVAGINEAKKLAIAATDKEKSKVYDKLAKKPGKNPVDAQERKYKAAIKTIDLNNRKEAIDKKAKVLAKMTVGAGTLATAGIIAANQIPLYNRNREKFIQEQSAYIGKCRNSLSKIKEKLNGVKALKESTAEEIYNRCIAMFESVGLEDMNNKLASKSADVFTEAYFGKTPKILDIEKAMAALYEEMKRNPYGKHVNTRLSKNLEKAVQNAFGYGRVVINIEPSLYDFPTIFTLTDIERFFQYKDISINRKHGYFDTAANHTAVIFISSTVPYQYGITPQEYTAMLLHEIGHTMDHTPYMMIRTVLSIITAPINILFANRFVGNIYAAVRQFVVNVLTTTPILNKLNELIVKAEDVLAQTIVPVLGTAAVVKNTNPLSLYTLPMKMLRHSPGRKTEEFADSFATAYGYGQELASGLIKFDNRNSTVPLYNTAVLKFINDIGATANQILLLLSGDEHGTTTSRIRSMIDNARNDLNTGNFNPEVKTLLEKDLIKLEKEYDIIRGLRDSGESARPITDRLRRIVDKLFLGYPHVFARLLPNTYVKPTVESVDLEDETYTESTGNNKLLKRALNACKSDMKRDKKLVKEAIQAKEFADAHNYIKKTKDDLKEMKEIVKKVPTDAIDDAMPHIMFNLTEFSTNLLTAFAYRTLMKHVDADKFASNKTVYDIYSNSTPQGQQAILKGLNYISDESKHNKSTNTATKVKESLTKAAKGIPESVGIDALMTGYRKLKTKDEFTTNTYKNKVLIAIDAEIKKLDKLDKMVSVAELKK